MKGHYESALNCNIFFYFLVKLDKPFHLKVKRIAASKCIEVKWMKLNSGACIVRYAVALKSSSGEVLFNMAGKNIEKKKICNLSSYNRITDVQLTVSFKGISKVVTAKVSETPNSTSVPPASGMTAFSNALVLCPSIIHSS